MVARLQNIKTTIGDGSDESSAHSAEPSMIAEHANISSLPPKGANRRLRNWLILANIAAWALIIWIIRLILS